MIKVIIIMAIFCNIGGFILNLGLVSAIKKKGYKAAHKTEIEKLVGWFKHLIIFSIPVINLFIFLALLLMGDEKMIQQALKDGLIYKPNIEEDYVEVIINE